MESSKKEKDTSSIPILFNDSKDLYIGKGSLKYSKNSFKFLNTKPPQQKQGTSSASSKYSIKEFTIISKDKDKSKKTIAYKGREAPQDSTYILMKFNSDSIQMCPANKWINFVQSLNYLEEKIEDKEKKIEDKEDKRKKEIKEHNSILKQFFNFDFIDEMREDQKPKRKTRKKKGLLDNNKDEDLSEDDKKKKKKDKFNYEEDSHSSEKDPNLKDQSSDSELEKLNEEKEEKKKEEDKDKEKDDSDDLFDEDDKGLERAASEVDENESDKEFINDLLNNKRKREKYPDDNMKEELDNLLRKKGKMTYEEIYEDLIKKFKPDIVQQYIEQLLDEYTKKYNDGKETFYFLK